jgi:uncharacterized membrane protein
MTEKSIYVINLFAIVGTGMMAGVFLAFSTFVMAGLARLEPAQSIAAMQSINLAAVTPLFMTLLFGTAILCGVLGFNSYRNWDSPHGTLLFLAAGLYLIGSMAVTIFANVPLNDQLAVLDANSEQAASFWQGFLNRWLWWNHIRGLASAAACLLFIRALSS